MEFVLFLRSLLSDDGHGRINIYYPGLLIIYRKKCEQGREEKFYGLFRNHIKENNKVDLDCCNNPLHFSTEKLLCLLAGEGGRRMWIGIPSIKQLYHRKM